MSDSAYSSAVRGKKLSLKKTLYVQHHLQGAEPPKFDTHIRAAISCHRKNAGSKRRREDGAPSKTTSKALTTPAAIDVPSDVLKSAGAGTVTSIGDRVSGRETLFMAQCHVGDVLELTPLSTSTATETRVITQIHADSALTINAPWSCDLMSQTKYSILHMPEEFRAKWQAASGQPAASAAAAAAPGEAQAGTLIRYRVKTGKSYKIVEKRITGDVSAGDLLDMRVARKGDRHCM